MSPIPVLKSVTLYAAGFALGLALLAPLSSSAATLTDIGVLPGGDASHAYAVSSDGSIVVGSYFSTNDDVGLAVRFEGGVLSDLGAGDAVAFGISGNGLVVVGNNVTTSGPWARHAFKLVDGVITILGAVEDQSVAYAASFDGSVIVGTSNFGGSHTRAFRYTDLGGMDDLGTMGAGITSVAKAVSSDGSVIVGYATVDAGGAVPHAFKYMGSTMSDLGTLSGGDRSWANGVSGDGSVIVGGAIIEGGSVRAFRHTRGDGMVSLGVMAEGADYSEAHAISADGLVIVGEGNLVAAGNSHAFKYVDGVFTDIGLLPGGTFSRAWAVNADGTVVVGDADTDGQVHGFVYADAVMLDINSWMASISGPAGILPTAITLGSLPMEGAHHRTLISYGNLGKKNQVWATGDFGNSSRSVDRNITSGEMGVSTTLGDRLVAGLALGYGEQNQDLIFDGYSHLSGQYAIAEADYLLGDKESIVSLTAMFGSWKSDTLRGYDTGSGTDYSRGATDLSTLQVRARLDGPTQKFFNGFNLTPYASFTWGRSSADAYTETGGSFDAQFDKQTHNSYETRLGANSKYALGAKTDLTLSAEWIHRFDGHNPTLTGVDVDHGLLPFSVTGERIHANQARFGIDLDQRLDVNTQISFSVHATTVGETHDVSGAISLRRGF